MGAASEEKHLCSRLCCPGVTEWLSTGDKTGCPFKVWVTLQDNYKCCLHFWSYHKTCEDRFFASHLTRAPILNTLMNRHICTPRTNSIDSRGATHFKNVTYMHKCWQDQCLNQLTSKIRRPGLHSEAQVTPFSGFKNSSSESITLRMTLAIVFQVTIYCRK